MTSHPTMDLSPFDFFRQETSSPDAVIRTEAMSRVTVIAAMMGPEKTKNDLLPYLLAKMDDLDQVLLVVANKIGDFVPFIGGSEHAHVLILVLESLVAVEETVVRTAASASACKILQSLSPANKTSIQAYFNFFKRISNEETGGEIFYSRVSACQMIHELYKAMPDPADKATLREMFATLSRDEMTMVRRAAAYAIPKIALCVDNDIVTGEFLQLLKTMTSDEHATVKCVAIEDCITYSSILNKLNASGTAGLELVPIIRGATDDPSWKVRMSISREYGLLANCFSPEVCTTEFLPGVINLLQDPEADVRVLALAGTYPFFLTCGSEIFMNETVATVQQLADDPIIAVCKSVAELCVDVAANSAPEGASYATFIDTICRLLADEDPLVRLRIIKKTPLIAEKIPDLCAKITPSLKLMFTESNWRVRKELVLTMPAVAKHMGVDFFTEHFIGEYLARMKDGVHDVRHAATSTLPHMVTAVSAGWVYDNVFPTIRGMAKEDFLNRLVMLDAVRSLCETELPDRFRSETVALLVASSTDTVANIRLRVAQVAASIGPKIGRDVYLSQLKPTVTQLLNDRDRDVKYFASEAVKQNH